jgi:hypothetical protein
LRLPNQGRCSAPGRRRERPQVRGVHPELRVPQRSAASRAVVPGAVRQRAALWLVQRPAVWRRAV